MAFVDVAVPLAVDQTFSYEIPPGMEAVRPGCRVLVSFARQHLVGLVVECRGECGLASVKPIRRILDETPLMSRRMVELGRWIADYYLASPGEVFRSMLPPGLLMKQASPDDHPEAFWPTKKRAAIVGVQAAEAGSEAVTDRQRIVLEALENQQLPILVRDVVKEGIGSDSVLRTLAAKGILRIEKIDIYRSPWSFLRVAELTRHSLSADQTRVVDEVRGLLTGGFGSALLHGVTASGKTEIYLNLIDTVLAAGRTALVLVPEIGLTPQIARQFRAWFGDRVAILHSALSDGERFDQWRRIRRGDAPVVVGTRSAVFAPLDRLGLIVVDEEHDASYKQGERPRYNGRDTALRRGQLEGAFVLLGSATPQLETYYAAVERKLHRYLPLRSRVQERALPMVHIVDMRTEFQKRGKGEVFSKLLRDKIADRLKAGEQVLILLNRRGYSRYLLCRSCGHTESCEHCSITLTYHQEFSRLSCHYCGYARTVPQLCSECGREFIYYVGEGTEKIEEILRAAYPGTAVDRLDRDTVQRRGSIERILDAFSQGRTRILVGTQMIAKGHDFPTVTLVGVLDADLGLKLADFRAAERTFQLLTQVGGRAGRGEIPGEVVLQTYYPNHYSLKYACVQEYEPFSERELQYRKKFSYPPFSALALLLVRDRDPDQARASADMVAAAVRARISASEDRHIRVLGPAPAAIEKIKQDYRIQILIKTTDRPGLHRVLRAALHDLSGQAPVLKRLTVDIDPLNLL